MNIRSMREGRQPTEREVRQARKLRSVKILQDDTSREKPLYSAQFTNEKGELTICEKKFTAKQFIKRMGSYEAFFDAESKDLFAAMKPKPVELDSPPASPQAAALIPVNRSISHYSPSSAAVFRARHQASDEHLIMGQEAHVVRGMGRRAV